MDDTRQTTNDAWRQTTDKDRDNSSPWALCAQKNLKKLYEKHRVFYIFLVGYMCLLYQNVHIAQKNIVLPTNSEW